MGFFVAGWFAFGRLWSLPWGSSDWGRTGGVVLAAVFLLLVGCSFAGGAPEGCILGLDWGGAGVSFILALAGAAGDASTRLVAAASTGGGLVWLPLWLVVGVASTWLVVLLLRLGLLLLPLAWGWCGFALGHTRAWPWGRSDCGVGCSVTFGWRMGLLVGLLWVDVG